MQYANEFPDVYTTRTIQPGDINMTHLAFNILMATGTHKNGKKRSSAISHDTSYFAINCS